MHDISYQLKLYITGRTSRSECAIEKLNWLCEYALAGQCEATVIDVLEYPELAEEDRVIATPMLIRVSPAPIKRVIGDLTNTDRVLQGLGIQSLQKNQPESATVSKLKR